MKKEAELYDKVSDFIKQNRMLEGVETVVVGLSGGADSVCLLLLLDRFIKEHALNINLLAVHINHGIRAEEADNDENYCKELAKRLGIEFVSYHKDIPAMAAKEHLSSEQMGRKVRYEAFRESAGEGKYRIAVAHHRNDQAETVLFHLARGSGLRGICGMKPVSSDIIRPLLCCTRQEIEDFLGAYNIEYCVDSTNLSNEYTRNKLRNVVLPYLCREINEGTVENITSFAGIANEALEYIDWQVKKLEEAYNITNGCISLKLWEEPKFIVKELIFRQLLILSETDIESKHVEQVYELSKCTAGKSINLPKGITVYRNHDNILISTGSEAAFTKKPAQSFSYEIAKRDEVREVYDFSDKKIYNKLCTKFFDYDKIIEYMGFEAEPEMRFRMPGDYLIINSDRATKPLNRVFIDGHIDNSVKDTVPVVSIGQLILWVYAVRTSESFRIDNDTRRVLILKIGE